MEVQHLESLHNRNKSLINYFWLTWAFGIVIELVLKASAGFILTLFIGGLVIFGGIHLLIIKRKIIRFTPYLIVIASYFLCYIMLMEIPHITTLTLFFYGMGMVSFYHDYKISMFSYSFATGITVYLFMTKPEMFEGFTIVHYGTFLAVLFIVNGTILGQAFIAKKNEKLLNDKNKIIEDEKEKIKEILGETKKSIANLSNFSKKLTQNIEENEQSYQTLTHSMDGLKNGVKKEIKHIEVISSLIKEMDSELKDAEERNTGVKETIKETNLHIEESREELYSINKEVARFKNIMSDTNKKFSELETSINDIDEFVKTIANISGQINLLALNASIEAAHAGEQGKGFMVVAEEVRKLSHMTKSAIENISQTNRMIKEKTSKTGQELSESVNILNHFFQAIKGFEESFQSVIANGESSNAKMQELEDIINELKEISEEVVHKIKDIDSVVKENENGLVRMQNGMSEQLESVQNISKEYGVIAEQTDSLDNLINN